MVLLATFVKSRESVLSFIFNFFNFFLDDFSERVDIILEISSSSGIFVGGVDVVVVVAVAVVMSVVVLLIFDLALVLSLVLVLEVFVFEVFEVLVLEDSNGEGDNGRLFVVGDVEIIEIDLE